MVVELEAWLAWMMQRREGQWEQRSAGKAWVLAQVPWEGIIGRPLRVDWSCLMTTQARIEEVGMAESGMDRGQPSISAACTPEPSDSRMLFARMLFARMLHRKCYH